MCFQLLAEPELHHVKTTLGPLLNAREKNPITFFKLAGRRPTMTRPHCEGILEKMHIGAWMICAFCWSLFLAGWSLFLAGWRLFLAGWSREV